MAVDEKFIQYNIKSTAVKRLMREARELKDPTEEYCAYPLDDNLFEWHFTVRGPPESDFEGGLYHGRILLPLEYPIQPPSIIMVTPNGRFETNKKICLSISGHHPETWQPSWSIRTALLAIIAFMPTPANGTIGSLDYFPEERKQLARRSRNWECPNCGRISELILNPNTPKTPVESGCAEEIISQNTIVQKQPQDVSEESVLSEKLTAPSKSSVDSTAKNVLSSCAKTSNAEVEVSSSTNSFLNVATAVIILIVAFLIYRRLYLM